MTPAGSLTTVYNVCSQSGCPDGNYLYAGLIQATDGNLYGIMQIGGTYGDGNNLQDHYRRHADHPLQLLLRERLLGRRLPGGRAGAGYQW